ncbi:MAG TPA: cell division protein CrgA [Acidimicrobiales bacterium]|nr:cell division protein CrgA [Acidimicrobiales bacterium]
MAERKASSRRTSRTGSGRVTPKGTKPGGRTGAPAARVHTPSGQVPGASTRYTPPIPPEEKVSAPWVPVLMFGLLALGALVIIVNYLGLLPGDADNRYLLVGLVMITGGFITATKYH